MILVMQNLITIEYITNININYIYNNNNIPSEILRVMFEENKIDANFIIYLTETDRLLKKKRSQSTLTLSPSVNRDDDSRRL